MLPEIAPLNENTPSYYHYKAKDQGVEEKQKFEVQPKINKPINICFFSPVHRTIFRLICEVYKYHSAKRAVDAALSNSSLLMCSITVPFSLSECDQLHCGRGLVDEGVRAVVANGGNLCT